MRHLRLTWLATALLLAGCTQLACNRVFGPEPFRGHTNFREAADAKGLEAVVVTTRNGRVQVRGDAAATGIEIKGEKWARGQTQEAADELTGRIEIQIRPDPARADRLQITAVFPEAPGHNMGRILPLPCRPASPSRLAVPTAASP